MNKENIKETDRAVYNAATTGDPYHGSASANAMFDLEKKWFEDRLAKIGQNRKIGLEIGCGGGAYLSWLAQHADFVIGLDHSIKAAKDASLKYSNDPRFAIMIADAEMIPLRNCAADLILCGSILHHLPDYGKSLTDLYKSLNVNGVLFASEPCAYNPFAVIRRKFFPSIFHTPDEHPFPPNEVIAQFKRNFDLVYYKRLFLFSINASVVEQFFGKRLAALYLITFVFIDNIILKIPVIRNLCWRIDLVGIRLPKSASG